MNHVRVPFLQIYRINALRALGCCAFFFLAITAPPPSLPLLGLMFDVVGALAIFIAVAGRGWTLFYIGGRKNAVLVTNGPYSVSRNPLYFFSLVGIAGVGAQTGSLITLVIFVLTAYLAFDMAMRGEETYLRACHGHRFDEYKAAVPRLWPNPSLWQECEDIPLRSGHAITSLRDGLVFIGAWIAIEFIRLAQSGGLLPVVWTLPI